MHHNIKAVVIRSVDYRDADRMLTVLTEHRGTLSIAARGARRKGSVISAISNVFSYADMTVFEHRGRLTLEEGESLARFDGISSDITRLALASYIAEVLSTVPQDDSTEDGFLRLALNCFYAISNDIAPLPLVKAAFELRFCEMCGYRPEIFQCEVCAKQVQNPQFHPKSAGVRCFSCRPLPHSGKGIAIDRAAHLMIKHIVSCELKKLFSIKVHGKSLEMLSEVAEKYATIQLERGFKTLDFYKTVGEIHD